MLIVKLKYIYIIWETRQIKIIKISWTSVCYQINIRYLYLFNNKSCTHFVIIRHLQEADGNRVFSLNYRRFRKIPRRQNNLSRVFVTYYLCVFVYSVIIFAVWCVTSSTHNTFHDSVFQSTKRISIIDYFHSTSKSL